MSQAQRRSNRLFCV